MTTQRSTSQMSNTPLEYLGETAKILCETGEVSPVSVAGQTLVDDHIFPIALSPNEQLAKSSAAALSWMKENGEKLRTVMLEHGGILLRGFPLSGAAQFEESIDAAGFEEMPYVGGAAPREVVTQRRVLTANESPPEQPIPFHHEMAQVPSPPSYVFFYCEIAPMDGGATPIISSHLVYRRFREIDEEFCLHLEKQGAKYVRVMPSEDDPSSPIGRSWRSTFQVRAVDEALARLEAEDRMKQLGTTWRWLENGDLYTQTAPVPAIRVDERTGRSTFFNSMVAAYTGWIDERNDPTQAVLCGDGSPVNGEALLATAEMMRAERAMFAWEKGDQLWLDNRLVMHSRQPFSGERRILAAIAP